MIFSGIRNNNPGNIIWSRYNNWQGQTGKDERGFAQFADIYSGYRAMAKLLRNYISQGNNSLRKIIYKWSPPSGKGNTLEGTNNYVAYVSRATNIAPDEVISFSDGDMVTDIMVAMTEFEHGRDKSSYITASLQDLYSAYNNIEGTNVVNPSFAGVTLPIVDVEAVDPRGVAVLISVAVIVLIIIVYQS